MAGPFDDAFEDLYRRYLDRVVSLLLSFGFTRERARDLAQDVFVRVYRSMESYRGEARWAFLQKTARNVALNALREDAAAKRKAETVSIDASPGDPEDQDLDPERAAAKSEIVGRVRTAIETLSPRLRDTLLLYLEGLSYRDITQTLRITEDAVKTRLHEARVQLRAILGEAPEGIE